MTPTSNFTCNTLVKQHKTKTNKKVNCISFCIIIILSSSCMIYINKYKFNNIMTVNNNHNKISVFQTKMTPHIIIKYLLYLIDERGHHQLIAFI